MDTTIGQKMQEIEAFHFQPLNDCLICRKDFCRAVYGIDRRFPPH